MQDRKDKYSVGQWMTQNPTTVKPATSVRAAFATMRLAGFRHLPVVDGEELLGIVTDRDLRRPDVSDDAEGWADWYALEDDREVREVMTDDVVTVAPHDKIEKALATFTERRFGAMPVLGKDGRLIGILTVHDLLKAFAEAMKKHGEHLRRNG